MDYLEKWKIIEDLGAGGQGKVYRVFKSEDDQKTKADIIDSLNSLTGIVVHIPTREKSYEKFRNALFDLFKTQDPSQQGALKVLHKSDDTKAHERIKREIQAMSKKLHSNLIEILDIDPDFKWYVSRFYQNGTLANNKDMFKGDLQKSLKAIRPLVEGVAILHKNGYVHRDIKPQNVFLNYNNDLILGDFGLVHFIDELHTRISETYENVGSRDWMPTWAMGIRIDDIKPSFDVFTLGKLLWSMISGKSILQLWYFERESYNVEKLFPNSPYMRLANELFQECIVEEEKNCLADASLLLNKINAMISIMDLNADVISTDIERPCKVCGLGKYNLEVDSNPIKIQNFGFHAAGSRTMKIFACSHCGHVQIFSYLEGALPAAWKKSN